MTETIADRFRRLATSFATVIESVPADRWDAATPCEGWTVADVVDHVATTQREFLERMDSPSAISPPTDHATRLGFGRRGGHRALRCRRPSTTTSPGEPTTATSARPPSARPSTRSTPPTSSSTRGTSHAAPASPSSSRSRPPTSTGSRPRWPRSATPSAAPASTAPRSRCPTMRRLRTGSSPGPAASPEAAAAPLARARSLLGGGARRSRRSPPPAATTTSRTSRATSSTSRTWLGASGSPPPSISNPTPRCSAAGRRNQYHQNSRFFSLRTSLFGKVVGSSTPSLRRRRR